MKFGLHQTYKNYMPKLTYQFVWYTEATFGHLQNGNHVWFNTAPRSENVLIPFKQYED